MLFNWNKFDSNFSIELNTIFFSFAFNMVNVFIEISIELNLVELNQIQFIIETNLNSI
jgi:hypothetical protein